VESIVVPTFLPDAIIKTKELNLGTKEEYLNEMPDKSNYLICMEYYDVFMSDYKQRNTNHSEFMIILDFVKNNFIKFSLVKVFSPITFISLSSSTPETILNFILNIILILISIISLKKILKENRSEIVLILCVIMGYSFVFFLSACYIRYSLPTLFLLYPFSGIYISDKLKKIMERKS
jgi:hypothetical protein